MLKHLVILISISILVGCVSNSEQKTTSYNREPVSRSEAKFIEKPLHTDTTGTATSVPTCDTADTHKFYLMHVTPDKTFSPDDHCFFNKLNKNPENSSIEQAALIVGVIKLSLIPESSASFIKTPDQQDSNQNQLAKSLEELTIRYNINLTQAIAINPLLRSFTIFAMINKSLDQKPNSKAFSDNLRQTLNQQSQQWQTLGLVTPRQSAVANSENLENSLSSEQAIAVIRKSDSVLLEAQTLANGRNFYEAINKAMSIERQSPLYPSAQEKVSYFSNQAVQELRQKAATAFQSAIPLSDPKVRYTYLEQAKKHLEEALSNYPHAPQDQLTTVRENLLVITKNLDQIPESD